jgi:hypothetical protein
VLANDTRELREQRRSFARENDWDQRVDELSKLIIETVRE